MDMWWSEDGIHWFKVNYEEGRGESAYSSMEWALTEVSGSDVYLGKWGHQMINWKAKQNSETGGESEVPALYMIGGDSTGYGSLSNAVFVSNFTLLCSLEGIVCSNRGICNGFAGCSCEMGSSGEFCEFGKDAFSAAHRNFPFVSVLVVCVLHFII